MSVTPPLPVPTLKAISVPPGILKGEKIAFLKDKNLQIINVGSRALASVTGSGNVSRIFGWSHDGSKLLLGVGEYPVLPETDMPGEIDLWSLDVWTGSIVQLTQGMVVRSATWSPVNNQIAYVIRNGGLYAINGDGTELKKLSDKAIHSPVWSPNGEEIAFILPPSTWKGGLVETYDIALVNLADASITQLTSEAWTNFHPIWSLDGKRILFESDREHTPGTGLWYIVNIDGSGLRHLEKPAFLTSMNVEKSPIDDLVVYEVSGDIWVMDFDGNTSKVISGSDPNWSADGTRLTYVGWDGGIRIVNRDGRESEKFIDDGSQPYWSN